MKLKPKDDQILDTLLLRRGNKIPMERVTKTNFGADTEFLPANSHQGIHRIYNHQTQTLLHMPEWFCWQHPDIACSCVANPVPGKYRSGCSQSSIGWTTGPLMKELEKYPGAKGVPNPIRWTITWTNQYPQSYVSSCIYDRDWPSQPSMGGEALGLS